MPTRIRPPPSSGSRAPPRAGAGSLPALLRSAVTCGRAPARRRANRAKAISRFHRTGLDSSFCVDSRFRGNDEKPVDSRFRGNDGNRQLQRACSLDVPCATAGRSASVARFRGNDEKPVDSRFRGNDGNRQLQRACSLDVPCATAGRSASAARFRGNDEKPVDSRFRGNDESRQLQRACSLDVPCATAGRSASVARFRGNDEKPVDSRFRGNDEEEFPSFPRKLATARGSVPAVAEGLLREYVCSSRLFPSFPRKRESTRAVHVALEALHRPA